MKIGWFITLAILIASCESQEISKPEETKTKEIFLSFRDIKISSGSLNGGRILEPDKDPTYLFIEIKKGEIYYATGVFKEIPQTLNLRLPDKVDFTFNIKAIKKGSSYGILRYQSGIYTNINWSVAEDSLNYQNPIHNGADAGLCYVYTKPDSSTSMYQYYPQTETYATQFTINTANISDTVKVNLESKVFGIESRIHNFEKGMIKVMLAEEENSTNVNGPSGQVLNYPDSSKLDIYSLMVLTPQRPNMRLRVIYNDTEKDQVIYNGWVEVDPLEKKILDIDLARYNSIGGFKLDFNLSSGQLKEGEIIKIN
jgi:hypothetical protein